MDPGHAKHNHLKLLTYYFIRNYLTLSQSARKKKPHQMPSNHVIFRGFRQTFTITIFPSQSMFPTIRSHFTGSYLNYVELKSKPYVRINDTMNNNNFWQHRPRRTCTRPVINSNNNANLVTTAAKSEHAQQTSIQLIPASRSKWLRHFVINSTVTGTVWSISCERLDSRDYLNGT